MNINTFKDNAFLEYNSESELSLTEIELLTAARRACQNSYSPYSNFQVGAAIRLENGEIVIGSNQENAAYPSAMCAERVALFNIGVNYKDKRILQVAVAAKRANKESYLPVTPCGGCRQVLLEFENRQHSPIEFLMRSGVNSWIKTSSCRILLPFSFDGDSL